jgi:glycosyltransferase involved in cell wall biosynthesis
MKIVHFIGSSGLVKIRGDHRHVLYLAKAQRERGMNAVVVTTERGVFLDVCKKDAIPVFVADDLMADKQPPGAKASRVAMQEVVAKLTELSPEIIHCHNLDFTQVLVVAANVINIPCVMTMHTPDAYQVLHQASAQNLKLSVIAVSRKEFEAAPKTDMTGIDFYYVPNGTPSGAYRQVQRVPSAPSLMTVGSLEYRKGIDVAILAMAELRGRHGPGCPTLNIYGEGPQSDYLIEMTKVLHLDDVVKFHGAQIDVWDRADRPVVLIVPSRGETGPLVVLEAMSRGMAIVSCDVGEVSEMLPDRRYGRIVPVDSITALADAIDAVLTDVTAGRFDPDLLIARHQSQYSVDKMVDDISTVYQTAIARLKLAPTRATAPAAPRARMHDMRLPPRPGR